MLYDHTAARNALALLQVAHAQWTEGARALQGVKVTDEMREASLKQYGYAFTILLVARGLDDVCKAKPAYKEARQQEVGLLDAARYAANRSVHQLTNLSRVIGGMSWPTTWPLAFDKLSQFQWAPEAHLPAIEEERDGGQRRLRVSYVELFAGRDMSEGLERLRRWFEDQLATLDV